MTCKGSSSRKPQADSAARRAFLLELGKLQEQRGALNGRIRVVVPSDSAEVLEVEFHFECGCPLQEQLQEYSRRTGGADFLLLELWFPPSFPIHPPSLRLVRPRLVKGRSLNLLGPTRVPSKTRAEAVPLSFGGAFFLEQLSSDHWRPGVDLANLLLDVRNSLLHSGVRVDMESVRQYPSPHHELCLNVTARHPTVAWCSRGLPAAPLERGALVFSELASVPPGRIVLPHQCATEVYSVAFGRTMNGQSKPMAVHIELKNMKNGARFYAGLAEVFAPQDSAIFMPSWMLKELFLNEGDEVCGRMVTLPLCGSILLQPHCQDFYDLVGEDAQLVLQEALSMLPALTAGTSVPVELPARPGTAGLVGLPMKPTPVFIARLEDDMGQEVIGVKLPGEAGIFGVHDVSVDFLPAPDLAESGAEYRSRASQEAARRQSVKLLDSTRQTSQAREDGAKDVMEQPALSENDLQSRYPDEGLELCLRLPNGRQLRRRFLPETTVRELKCFLQVLAALPAAPWQTPDCVAVEDLEMACAFPRRALEDTETVATAGDRAVLLVLHHPAPGAEPSGASVHEDWAAVLYPSELRDAIEEAKEAAASVPPRQSLSFDEILTSAHGQSAQRSIARQARLRPDPDLQAMAVSLGIPPADVARALDDDELAILVAAAQARQMESAPPTAVPSGAASSRNGATRKVTAKTLVNLGLTAQQFAALPPDTQEAILAVPQVSTSPSSSSSARPVQSPPVPVLTDLGAARSLLRPGSSSMSVPSLSGAVRPRDRDTLRSAGGLRPLKVGPFTPGARNSQASNQSELPRSSFGASLAMLAERHVPAAPARPPDRCGVSPHGVSLSPVASSFSFEGRTPAASQSSATETLRLPPLGRSVSSSSRRTSPGGASALGGPTP